MVGPVYHKQELRRIVQGGAQFGRHQKFRLAAKPQDPVCSLKRFSQLGRADKNLDYILKEVVRVFL